MVHNVTGKKSPWICAFGSCPKVATHGEREGMNGSRCPTHCATHRLPDQYRTAGDCAPCIATDCKGMAIYGYNGPIHCWRHITTRDVRRYRVRGEKRNVRYVKKFGRPYCRGGRCPLTPTYGYTGRSCTHCYRHKKEGMKCARVEAKKRPRLIPREEQSISLPASHEDYSTRHEEHLPGLEAWIV